MDDRPLHPTLNEFEKWAKTTLVPPLVNFDKDFSGRYCDGYTFQIFYIWQNGFQQGYSAARNPNFAKAAQLHHQHKKP
jgi:hypothetical protein